MNKEDIVHILSNQTGFTQKDLTEILDALFLLIIESTAAGEKIRIKDFGIFEIQNYASKCGQNINTHKAVFIPPQKVPVFRPGKAFRQVVKGG